MSRAQVIRRELCVQRMREIHELSMRAAENVAQRPGFLVHYPTVAKLIGDFEAAHLKVIQNASDEEFAAEDIIRREFDTMRFGVIGRYEKFVGADHASTSNPQAPARTSSIKLPKIPLPQFTGDLALWPSFIALFNASIHENRDLSPTEKYLVASLKGKALNVLPNSQVERGTWEHLERLKLADPLYHQPGPVDILLGAEGFASLLRDGRRVGRKGEPDAFNTVFGWILVGAVSEQAPQSTHSFVTLESLDASLSRFWQLDEIPASPPYSQEDRHCEELFARTTRRDPASGRLVVSYPFTKDNPCFVGTRELALKRFRALERRFKLDPDFKTNYAKFMQDYLDNDYMKPIRQPFPADGRVFYLPHHGVFKADSTTTKLRVVFDASSRDLNGVSLNQVLQSGPKLQTDIFVILLRFRIGRVALTADVKQRFLRILVELGHCNYQQIVWRFSEDEPILDYLMLTVVFGLTCSPFLAIACLLKLAAEGKASYPLAAAILEESVYVDDVVASVDSEEEARELQQQLQALLGAAGFELRKWASSHPSILANLSPELCSRSLLSFESPEEQFLKVLGLRWYPQTDDFGFQVHPLDRDCTKRTIRSELARIFDPLGFLTPLTFAAKRLIQQLWTLKLGWDDRPPSEICAKWERANPRTVQPYMADLPADRVRQAKPFSITGVDYAGPFPVYNHRSRGATPFKAYVCLFVCFTTKAVHLELAFSLFTDSFLSALRRFMARRGRCLQLYSDCGTNFVGAQRELANYMQAASEREKIRWTFNPPSAPHFGGLWEAGVKAMKTDLKRVIESQILTVEEFDTLIAQIEAILNSRPLCPTSSDPNDFGVLSPGHFLTLEPLVAVPCPDLEPVPMGRLDRWQLVQHMHQQFWRRWHDEYLHTLQQRSRWLKSAPAIPKDTLVLLKSENTPPLQWRRGRIVELCPGRDGVPRVATVRTTDGVLTRHLVKLCPFPLGDSPEGCIEAQGKIRRILVGGVFGASPIPFIVVSEGGAFVYNNVEFRKK
ncbi:uncharacterized protein [Temnothorax nylanderi]|uniref:uncharacterized protein n=1 Tax=Temnothorax nylanderi TaxID=102681 RepID=UPI003A8B4FF2